MPEFHFDVIALIVLLVSSIFSFAYLKFETTQNAKDIESMDKRVDDNKADMQTKHDLLANELRNKYDALGSDIRKEIGEMSKSLARIEGRLDSKNQHHS